MAMTIIQLGDTSKSDFSLLVGKSVLLKFTQKPPVLERSPSLNRLINSSLDLLKNEETLRAITQMVEKTGMVQKRLSWSIRNRDSFKEITQGDESMVRVAKDGFKRFKDFVDTQSKEIAKTESGLGLFLAHTHELYFCAECCAYLGPVDEMLPSACQACGQETNPKAGKKASSFRFLSQEVHDYLAGKWIQDYAARRFKTLGWRTWSECDVMGSSGVNHQIDLLAVHEQTGRVVIAECKTQAVSDDAFRLITQFSDIQPDFGLLISLNPMNACGGKSLIAKKPGLKLIELFEKSDLEVKEMMDRYVSSDN